MMRQVEADLFNQLGGRETATATQRLLVERIASDVLRLRLYDQKILAGEELSLHEGRILNALRNSVRLGLKSIGLDSAGDVDADPRVDSALR